MLEQTVLVVWLQGDAFSWPVDCIGLHTPSFSEQLLCFLTIPKCNIDFAWIRNGVIIKRFPSSFGCRGQFPCQHMLTGFLKFSYVRLGVWIASEHMLIFCIQNRSLSLHIGNWIERIDDLSIQQWCFIKSLLIHTQILTAGNWIQSIFYDSFFLHNF